METKEIIRIYQDEEGNMQCELGNLQDMGIELVGLLESLKMRIFLNDDADFTTEEQNP
jgi:hypothetical protein